LLFAAALAGVAAVVAPARVAAADTAAQITILYDAFGSDTAMKKDWGFSALVEISGKRILFDTGNDPDIFAANVRAKNIDLTSIDFVVLSHRHSDHMAGLNHVLSVNPKVKIYAPKEGFGIFGSSLPSQLLPKGRLLATGDALLRWRAAGGHEVRRRMAARQLRADRQDNGNRARHHVDRTGVRRSRHEGAQGTVARRQHR
jgi:glyoxylase-like metal-dependent hydrolase (beta-lactamase superfamily II)